MKIQNVNAAIPPMASNVMIPVFAAKPKLWLKPTDQIDTWLDSQGFYRKHIARDASSLFRCVSEKIFLTQVHHITVRKHCIQFALNQPEIFKQLTDIPVKDYVDRVHNQHKWGNTLDMEIMSRIYDVDFAIYKEIKKPIEHVTSNGHDSIITLSLSYEHHYDSVYPKQHITNTGVCQSILYEMLYKNVFKMEEVDYAVNKMLHDKTVRYQPDLTAAFFSPGFQMRFEMRDNCKNAKDLFNCGIIPFPYKVAKSLDSNLYRNVEYDLWNEHRKGMRHNMTIWNNRELQEGTKCLVNFKTEDEIIKRHGYIQKMSPDKGPVVVFIEELGEKVTVPYESLELIPVSTNVGPSDSMINMFAKLDCNESKTQYSILEENIENSSKMRESFQSNGVPSNPDLCSVQYIHSTASTVPTTCYACISSHSYAVDNNLKPVRHLNSTDEHHKYNQAIQHTSEITNTAEPPVSVVQYPVPLYPVMSQDVGNQSSSYSNNAFPPKPTSNPNEPNDTTNSVRVFCNNNVEQYYRCGLPTVPYYFVSPNYVYPVSMDPPAGHPQNTDIQRVPYSPPTVSQHQNELVYAMPVNNLLNSKADLPVYPPMMTYSNGPTVIKSSSQNNNTGDVTTNTTESPPYQLPKEMVYLKEPPPINTNMNISTIPPSNVPTNIYPLYGTPYPSVTPPVYYHSIEYGTSCYPTYSEMPAYPENITSPTYHVPQIVPVAYSEDIYQQSNQIICQPMLPPIRN